MRCWDMRTSTRHFKNPSARYHGICPECKLRKAPRAAVEATEEAVDNSLLKATDEATVKAIPVEKVREILRRYGRIRN